MALVGVAHGVDGVHLSADGVERDAEVCGGLSEGASLEDASGGDAPAGGRPLVAVAHDEDEAVRGDARDDGADAPADDADGDASELGDLGGVEPLAVHGVDEGAFFGEAPLGPVGDDGCLIGGEVSAEVGGLEPVGAAGEACSGHSDPPFGDETC